MKLLKKKRRSDKSLIFNKKRQLSKKSYNEKT